VSGHSELASRRRRLLTSVVSCVITIVAAVAVSVGAATKSEAANNSRTLQAINVQTGKTVWTKHGGAGFWGAAGTTDGVIIVVEGSCEEDAPESAVLGFDRTGKQRWRVETQGGVSLPGAIETIGYRPPGLSEGAVVWSQFSSQDKVKLQAVDPKSGRSLWTQTRDGRNSWTLAGSRDLVIIGPREVEPHLGPPTQTVRALDRNTGKQRWSRQLPTSGARTLTSVATDKIVVVNVDNRLWGLDPKTGAGRWTLELPVPERVYPEAWLSMASDSVAVVTQDAGSNQWASSGVNPDTGQLMWSGVPGTHASEPGNVALITTFAPPAATASVAATDAHSGSVLWTVNQPSIRFATTNGRVATVQTADTIRVLDAQTGAEQRTLPALPKSRTMTLADERLFLAGGC
jgi:outer membrane protein assembly factor BamB